jgi:hypothetical protein
MKTLNLYLVYGVYDGCDCEWEDYEIDVSDSLYKKLKEICEDCDDIYLDDVLSDYEDENEYELTAKQAKEIEKMFVKIKEDIIECDDTYLEEGEEINWNNLTFNARVISPDEDDE